MANAEETVINVNDTVMVERTFMPVVTDDKGEPAYLWKVYKKTPVVDGVHPHHGNPTTLEHVWMPAGEASTKDEALALTQGL